MDHPSPDPIKHREIGFRDPHPDPQQAQSAVLMLADVKGIVSVSIPDPDTNSVLISYNLNHVCLRLVEALLTELGFHLDNGLLSKIKRALYYYTEENELGSRGDLARDQDHSTRDIFMRCYHCKTHGCRDQRPEYWRKYL